MKCSKLVFPIIMCWAVFTFISLSQAKTIPGLEEYELGGEEGWELKRDKNGIKCYTRPVKLSPMHSFKGVGEVKGQIPELVAFLMDIERYNEWMVLVEKTYTLDRIDESESYIYTYLKPPWPASPRDVVVRRQWYYDEKTGGAIVTIKGVPEYVPVRKKVIRGYMITGYYQLMPRGDDTIEITYESVADPGGWLPVWLVNFCLVDTPYKTIKQIRSFQPYTEYKGITYSFLNTGGSADKNKTASPVNASQNIAIARKIDYKKDLTDKIKNTTYDKIKRYYFEENPYGATDPMRLFVHVEKGHPDVDIQVQTVEDLQWSDFAPKKSFVIKGEDNKGNIISIPDISLSRKSYTPSGVAFKVNGNGHKDSEPSYKIATELINSYMKKRAGADILLKIEKDKAPYITYLIDGKEARQKEYQDKEFHVAIKKYIQQEDKLVQKNVKEKPWWAIW